MREITTHHVNECNEDVKVMAVDEPSHGGASHVYQAVLPASEFSPDGVHIGFPFQKGPIKEVGVNGITHEILLAILIDRLEHFQAGPYACQENAEALSLLEGASFWLKERTRKRMARNVEGTHNV